VPGAPAAVKATAGYSSIRVSWSAPAANGVTITGYRATADPGPATCSTTGETTCLLGGQPGTSYTVTVVALSAGGESAASAASSAVTPTPLPLATTAPESDLPLDTGDGVSTVAPGGDVVVAGDGYAPYSSVTLTVYSTPILLATVTADGDGAFSQAVRVPADLEPGTHSFVAAGVDPSGQPRSLRVDLTIAAGSGGGGGGGSGGLPVTGPAILWLLVIGFGLTLGGVALRQVR
jgi:Fibronectin type III domain